MQANIKLAQPREWQPARRARSLSIQIKQQLKIENLFTIAHHGTFPGGGHHRNRRSTIGRILQLLFWTSTHCRFPDICGMQWKTYRDW
jgi:hypothetical protein